MSMNSKVYRKMPYYQEHVGNSFQMKKIKTPFRTIPVSVNTFLNKQVSNIAYTWRKAGDKGWERLTSFNSSRDLYPGRWLEERCHVALDLDGDWRLE